jgi:hypothetical protein
LTAFPDQVSLRMPASSVLHGGFCVDKKVVRDLREKELKVMMMWHMGDFKGAMALMLDCFDDLDDAMHFFARRERGTLLDLAPGQKLDRWGTTVHFGQRPDRDPELRAEMHRHPRYLAALLAHEAQGLPIIGFLAQVREVRFVEEEPGLHWLLLPECHRGCESLDGGLQVARSYDSCLACGRPQGAVSDCSTPPSSLTTEMERIHAADDYVVRSVAMKRFSREDVLNDPAEAFAEASQALFGKRPDELFGIHNTQLAADTDTMLYFIHLADHAPKHAARDHHMALAK